MLIEQLKNKHKKTPVFPLVFFMLVYKLYILTIASEAYR